MLKCNLPWFFKITVVFKGYIDKTKLKQFSLLISTNWLEKFITNSNASSQDAKSPLLFLTLCIVQNSSVCYIYSNNIMFPRKKLLQAVPQLWDLCMFLQSNFTFWYWKTNVKHKFECIYSLHHLTLFCCENLIVFSIYVWERVRKKEKFWSSSYHWFFKIFFTIFGAQHKKKS